MTVFLRLLSDSEKERNLLNSCAAYKAKRDDSRTFEVDPESFKKIPGAPFSYWVNDEVREFFEKLPAFEGAERFARQGGVNGDDFRWLRMWFEQPVVEKLHRENVPIAKGGAFGRYYSDLQLVARWNKSAETFHSFVGLPHRPSLSPASAEFYFRPGLTWPRRTNGLSFRVLPRDCIFADKGPTAFVAGDDGKKLLALCAILNSQPFGLLVSVQLARTELAQSYEVGLVQQTPVPDLNAEQETSLAMLARRAWSLKRALDTIAETSHAFHLPAALLPRLRGYCPPSIEDGLAEIQLEIDEIAFSLYGFSEADRSAALGLSGSIDKAASDGAENPDDSEEDDSGTAIDQTDGLLSWAVGIAFGRFDWRIATGERDVPPEPDPFDPLPAKSPGMLPDGAAPFHDHSGILADDQGHPHDLPRLIEEVLARVQVDVPGDVRRWLERDFFPLHLKQYSKSRRKAPIYWPLSTTSGSYTLWLYYPSLTNQTLYTAVNDFVEPKLKQVSRDAGTLRDKGSARSHDDIRALEALQTLELELIDLRDLLLQIAPTYRPNHDDGVQITAAPLWELFRHKPWQKVLKDTWAKLKKGDYDWAHLAMAYWPDRVREKCKTDKSLAIAHGLEGLYQESPKTEGKKRGRKKAAGA